MDTNNPENLLNFFRKKFKDGFRFNVNDYLHAFGKESDALLYSTLFCPDFVEIESSVFLKRNVFDENEIRKEILQAKKKPSEIEESYNFVEVGYLFDCSGRDVNDEEEILLTEKIKEAWEGSLKFKFPNRKFIIKILTPDESGSTFAVQFYEERES